MNSSSISGSLLSSTISNFWEAARNNSQNKDALSRYEALVNQYYKEPVDGKFEDVTATILNDIDLDTDEEVDETSSDR